MSIEKVYFFVEEESSDLERLLEQHKGVLKEKGILPEKPGPQSYRYYCVFTSLERANGFIKDLPKEVEVDCGQGGW